MAIDFLIFVLLLITLSINLLALGAFWVTPALRTTANRFVINLLIVNIIGSLVLGPTLFLNTSSSWKKNDDSSQLNLDNNSQLTLQNSQLSNNDNDLKKHDSIIPNEPQIRFNSLLNDNNNDNANPNLNKYPTVIEEDVNIIVNGTQQTRTHSQCNRSECETIIIQTDSKRDKIVITEIDEEEVEGESDQVKNDDQLDDVKKLNSSNNNGKKLYRCWSIDLAAALSALSVLLVVGDTWCAVTDPLRYHTRISGLRSWVLIAMTWFFGILFGVLSALRDHVFAMNKHEISEHTIEYKDTISTVNNQLFDEKITSHQYEDHRAFLQPNDLYNMIFSSFYFIVIILLPFGFVCGMYWRIFSEARENGLRMRQNGSSPLLQSALNLSAASAHQHQLQHQNLQQSHIKETASNGGLIMKIDEASNPLLASIPIDKPNIMKPDRNQNILLTLSAANDEMRRNYSARHLSSLSSSLDFNESDSQKNNIRHVHSTPNLQRDPNCSLFSSADHAHHVFQLPSVHISPKALSYMSSIRHRLSNASSLFKYREESRAARISILVVIMFLISYLPYGLLVLLQSRLSNLISDVTQIAIMMVLMANLSSPFIFAYRNKRVRHGVQRLFGLDPKDRERQLIRRGGGIFRCGTKASIQVRRSVSKASTYSVNSCKYLTPHAVTNGTFVMEIEKCHFLKNTPHRPVTHIDQVMGYGIEVEKRSILKRVCDSSRKLGCTSNSCANSDNEQTDL